MHPAQRRGGDKACQPLQAQRELPQCQRSRVEQMRRAKVEFERLSAIGMLVQQIAEVCRGLVSM